MMISGRGRDILCPLRIISIDSAAGSISVSWVISEMPTPLIAPPMATSIPSQAQIIRHVAEFANHFGTAEIARSRIAGAAERNSSNLACLASENRLPTRFLIYRFLSGFLRRLEIPSRPMAAGEAWAIRSMRLTRPRRNIRAAAVLIRRARALCGCIARLAARIFPSPSRAVAATPKPPGTKLGMSPAGADIA
jgi:hypothetical protein